MNNNYKITKITSLHEINIKAKSDKELKKLYKEGVIDEVLSEKNEHIYYLITDKNGKKVFEHTYK